MTWARYTSRSGRPGRHHLLDLGVTAGCRVAKDRSSSCHLMSECRSGGPAERRRPGSPGRVRFCFPSGMAPTVRMLCSRSPSFMSRTLGPWPWPRASCAWWRPAGPPSRTTRSSLVTPSTIWPRPAPNPRRSPPGWPGVLDRVVQQGGGQGYVVHAQPGQDRGHGHGMGYVGLAGAPADLALVGLGRQGVPAARDRGPRRRAGRSGSRGCGVDLRCRRRDEGPGWVLRGHLSRLRPVDPEAQRLGHRRIYPVRGLDQPVRAKSAVGPSRLAD